MAEFPELGAHCGLPTCSQLDFLPLVCAHCAGAFCKLHAAAEAHLCQKLPPSPHVDEAAPPPASYPCHLSGCSAAELAPVTCADCQQPVCLAHRHPAEHACAAWQARQAADERTRCAEQRAAAEQAGRLAAPLSQQQQQQPPRSERARRTAATVQLMRLKQRAQGDGRVPLADRHYLLVWPPAGGGGARPLFVSRRWTLGRALDSLAELCGVTNENDRSGGRRLVLVTRGDGGRPADRLDAVIAELPAGQLDSGETVELRYED